MVSKLFFFAEVSLSLCCLKENIPEKFDFKKIFISTLKNVLFPKKVSSHNLITDRHILHENGDHNNFYLLFHINSPIHKKRRAKSCSPFLIF